jgi:hypothetical protein
MRKSHRPTSTGVRSLADRPYSRLSEADGLLGECGEGFAWVLYCVLHGLDHEQADVDQSDVEHFWESILGEGGDSKIEDEDFALGFCKAACEAAADACVLHGG